MLMLNLPLTWQHLLGPLLLTLVCGLLFCLEPQSSHYLAYDRVEIQQFQLWRFITGNLLHTNANHLYMNLAGVLLLWALHGWYFNLQQYTAILLFLSISTTLGIYVFASQLHWYVGLSGLLHGVMLLGAYFDIRKGLKSGWLLLLGVIVKVAHEQIFGASQDIANLINANVAIDAHLYGTLSGLCIIIFIQLRKVLHAAPFKTQ